MSAASSSSSLLDWQAATLGELDVSDLDGPSPRTYISFTLDVRQTLDTHRCDIDEETEEAIKQFTLRKYVAYLLKNTTYPVSGSPPHGAVLRLLQQGLPDPLPHMCFDASMSVPVAPESVHPLNRPPVKTNRPLPWDDCYHPTVMDFSLRLIQCNYDYTDAFHLDIGDHLRTDRWRWEDDQRMEANLASKEGRSVRLPFALQSCSSLHMSDVDGPESFGLSHSDFAIENRDNQAIIDYDSDGDSDAPASVYSDGDSHTASSSHASEDDLFDPSFEPVSYNELLQCAQGFHDADNDPQFTPVAKYSPDLSGIPFLYDINQFNKDVKELEELVRKCREGPPIPAPTLDLAVDPVEGPEPVTVTDLKPDDNQSDNPSHASGSGFLTCLRKGQMAIKTRVVKLFTIFVGKRRMNV